MDIILLAIAFIVYRITGRNLSNEISAGILMIGGFLLFVYYVRKYRDILVPPAIFSLSWLFCIGITCLKLSNLQTEWCDTTWDALFLSYIAFILCFRFIYYLYGKNRKQLKVHTVSCEELFAVIIAFTVISLVSFSAEACILDFIPLFTSEVPHAYSTFHISGVHYFTVLCVLVPSFSVLFFHKTDNKTKRMIVLFCDLLCFVLPILMVSRFQLIFSILIAGVTWIILNGSMLGKYLKARNILILIGVLIIIAGLYLFITVERAHSVEYLNSIFEMKNETTPIFITQPYIYIANNFENFDCLVKNLDAHTNGLRSAYPVFALSGLKFLHPELVSFPLYVTKEELTTVTLLYDAYYDFGTMGCIVFSAILGSVYSLFYRVVKERKNDILLLIYSQMTAYLMLAFFTTWYSNPTTWFYFGICILTEIVLMIVRNHRKNKKRV